MRKPLIILLYLLVFSVCAKAQNDYPVRFAFNKSTAVAAGGKFSLSVTFSVDSGYYIYAPTGVNQAQGMLETKVTLRLPSGFVREGKMQLPVSHFKGGFEIFNGKGITMTQEIVADKTLKPGDYTVNAGVKYQTCRNEVCLPPQSAEIVFKVIVNKDTSQPSESKVKLGFNALDGRNVNLENLKGKLVLIDCWASWCRPCIAEFDNLKRIYNKYHKSGLEIIGICADESTAAQRVKQLVKQHQLPWPQYFEGKGFDQNSFIKTNNIQSLPAVFLLNKDGEILDKDARGEHLDGLILQYLSN